MEERRINDLLMKELGGKFDALLNQLEKESTETIVWREKIEARLGTMEIFLSNVKWGWKIVIGIFAGIGGFAVAGIKLYQFLSSHWKS